MPNRRVAQVLTNNANIDANAIAIANTNTKISKTNAAQFYVKLARPGANAEVPVKDKAARAIESRAIEAGKDNKEARAKEEVVKEQGGVVIMRKRVALVECKKDHDKDGKDNSFSLAVVVSNLGATRQIKHGR
jgi:xanthine dehydrogenase molybdopterin-binding subunit B